MKCCGDAIITDAVMISYEEIKNEHWKKLALFVLTLIAAFTIVLESTCNRQYWTIRTMGILS